MFAKILIANRGEVAVRIIRACREMGIRTVAVFSRADSESLHVSLADESVCIGEALARDSYLNQNAIVAAAKATRAQAIHPGYGFLAENSEFAALCEAQGITFIGPRSSVIARLGDKETARAMMRQASVPLLPGSSLVATAEEAKTESAKIGFPLLVKATAGGGGRGIRLAKTTSELENAFESAKTEARGAFGNEGVYLEKYLEHARHIEIQILADNEGNVVCLGERECSVQRHHQKLVEESPSCAVDCDTRDRMIDASVKAAKAAGYTGVGTVEFLLCGKDFYFMEMNTRLQVEHGVTEAVTGIDIVKWQIRICANVPLGFSQKDVAISGHALECRINLKGAANATLELLHVPGGMSVRFDCALYQGYTIPSFYDACIGKLIVWAQTREEAIRKMDAALCELILKGVDTNRDEALEIISDERFVSGDYDTNFFKD
ncbi:MAG: acetyl-CoA carboxylase biotin carboxylase subunit [Clostridia bacterium]|nr:acetyl-CoA carboxylase biotin carboxylase subunit [Clostridia bacterium]